MGIALFTTHALLAPLHDLLAWFVPVAARATQPSAGSRSGSGGSAKARHRGLPAADCRPAALRRPASVPTLRGRPSGSSASCVPAAHQSTPCNIIRSADRAASASCKAQAPQRAVRVLRVVDAQHTPSTAGRMVISGRMADVCAELDRLAEQAARLH